MAILLVEEDGGYIVPGKRPFLFEELVPEGPDDGTLLFPVKELPLIGADLILNLVLLVLALGLLPREPLSLGLGQGHVGFIGDLLQLVAVEGSEEVLFFREQGHSEAHGEVAAGLELLVVEVHLLDVLPDPFGEYAGLLQAVYPGQEEEEFFARVGAWQVVLAD